MSKLQGKLFFSTALPRTLVEVTLLGAILLYFLPGAIEQPPPDDMSLEGFVIAVCCALWGTLRFRRDARSRAKYLAALAMGVSVAAGNLALIAVLGKWSLLAENNLGPVQLTLISLTTGFMFMVFRASISLWLRWHRLRKQRLIWSFTHIQIVIVMFLAAVGSTVFAVAAIIRIGLQREPQDTLGLFLIEVATEVLPTIGAVVASTIVLVLILILPLSLLSYLLVRNTTRRLEGLVAGTSALREGDLSTRIAVSGEDEVAQLQGDFNKMAADLETAVANLEQERDRVTGLLRVQHELTATVSHELRTPVATIQGYLQPALARTEEVPGSDVRNDLVIINDEILRLQKLIDDLFDLSRAEVERLTLAIEPTDLSAVARRIVDVWHPLSWSQRRVDVICQQNRGEHIAPVDVKRIEQILTNLVHNAVQHTPPGGIVAVSIDSDDEWVMIDVRDTGEGISAEALPFVWEPFYRGDSDGGNDEGRTGLGLALVKAMTQAMGGNVQVESQIDQGSCFEVRFPKC